VGTSGKILCLLSGGIDSPVATFLMMKRGCTVDFLHFHTFRTNSDVLKTKINRLVDILNNYQDESKLYLIPYSGYEIFSQNKLWEKYDLIAFKYYMIKLAEKFALEKYYDAIITGDNLGQVASQTIENLKISSVDLKIPLFRPLITYDKQEIIDLAKKIGTYEMSIEKYKDCCSILSKNPSTRTSQEKFTEIMKNFDLDFLIEKSLKEIEKFDVK
jgi:thiamine biosynthesis protein ThiI